MLTIGENRITLAINIVTLAVASVSGIPPDYRAMCAAPNYVVTNSMACRMFRDIKFGRIMDSLISTSTLSTFRCEAAPVQISRFAQHTSDKCVVNSLGSTNQSRTDVMHDAFELSTKAASDVDEHGMSDSTNANDSKSVSMV